VGESPSVRLLALRVICNSIRFFSSAQLLQQLPTLVPVVLGSINSALADLRKAVVFILVEMYLGVGDSVFPHITALTPPQRKLMTIYVEKKMNERKNILATALRN
jgi:CLIP-associating protein 1/2